MDKIEAMRQDILKHLGVVANAYNATAAELIEATGQAWAKIDADKETLRQLEKVAPQIAPHAQEDDISLNL